MHANTTAAANHPTAIARALCARTRLASSPVPSGTTGPPHTPHRHRKKLDAVARARAPQWGQGLTGG
jgi:hypothetical protein